MRADVCARTLRQKVLKPGGSATVIEGDHGSWYCHPQTAEASRTVAVSSRSRRGLAATR